MRPFLRFSAILVVFVTSELPAAAQGTVETKKTDFKAKCPPQVWIKLGSEERRETTPGGDSASLPNEIDRLVKESDALDGVQLFLWKSRLGRSIEAERELKQVDAQYLPADLRKVVEGLQACHELRAAFASRGRDVRGIERSLTKLGDATRDANLVESLRSCLIEGERGETADPSKVSARLEQVAANFRERVVEHWKVACRDFARRAAVVRDRPADTRRVGFADRAIPRTSQRGGVDLGNDQDDDDRAFIERVEERLGPPPLSDAEKSLVRLMRRRGVSEAKVVAVLKKCRSAAAPRVP